MARFDNSGVVVTGAASGIGEGAARRFHQEGAALVLGDWHHSFYCAAKGAVTNFTRALAMDEAAAGVRVNAVNPSLTYTALTAGMKQQPDLIARFEERIPMRRGAQPEDIAGAIAFLASRDAHYITGVNLPVDGGLSASNGQPPLN